MKYALITGASKGIGKAIVEELAARKINLLLVARSEDLLQTLTMDIQARFGIKADWLAIDLAQDHAAGKVGILGANDEGLAAGRCESANRRNGETGTGGPGGTTETLKR